MAKGPFAIRNKVERAEKKTATPLLFESDLLEAHMVGEVGAGNVARGLT